MPYTKKNPSPSNKYTDTFLFGEFDKGIYDTQFTELARASSAGAVTGEEQLSLSNAVSYRYATTDAMQARSVTYLKRFTDWLRVNGVRGNIGEWAWPNNESLSSWQALGEKLYDIADANHLPVLYWAAYNAAAANPIHAYTASSPGHTANLTTAAAQATVIEAHMEVSQAPYRGLNYDGSQSGRGTLVGGQLASNLFPGVVNVDYSYPSSTNLAFLANRGFNVIRLPIRWERIQQTLGAALNTTEMGRIQAVIDAAKTNGMQVIPEIHNWGRYTIGTSSSSVTEYALQLTGGSLTAAHLVDLWQRLSTAWKAETGVLAYELMNEPHDLAEPLSYQSPTTTHYNFDAGTQSWVLSGTGTLAHSTATKYAGAGALSVTHTYAVSGADEISVLSPFGSDADISANGRSLGVRIFIPSAAAGTWRGRIRFKSAMLKNPASTYVTLTKGVWNLVTGTFSKSDLKKVAQFAVDVEGTNVNSSVVVGVDELVQGPSASQAWEQMSQQCVTAIRNNVDEKLIHIPGYAWNAARDWPTSHSAAFIDDPADNHEYSAHLYMDSASSGAYALTYPQEVTQSTTDGYSAQSTGVALKQSAIENLQVSAHSTDRGNADWALTADAEPVERFATALTGARNVDLPTTGVYEGMRFLIRRESTATGAFSLNVRQGGVTIASLTAADQAAQFRYDGTASTWRLEWRGYLSQGAANPDTSGATLAALETEVNQLKAALRAAGIIA